MAKIKPFKAIRPIPELAAQIAALPYDVMTSSEAREMTVDNPHSFLHVDKAEIDLEEPINLYDDKVYEKAKENLNKMITDKIMVQEQSPALYIYRLEMNGRGQTGIVACTSIDEYLSGDIKKHELTREDKEQDRIRHVEACNANTGPIFLTYRAVDTIDGIINNWTGKNAPVYDFTAEDGIRHTVWIIQDESVIFDIAERFISVPSLYIADGHHRNASAVKVGLKKREANPGYTGEEEYNYYLSVIFPHDQLYIMDYNRVVKTLNGNDSATFISKIKENFQVELIGETEFRPQERHTFGMYIEKNWYKLIAMPGTFDAADPVGSLDVSILQANLLAPVLGIQDPRTDKNIDFVGGMRGLQELSKRVDSGEMKVAFAMHPTSMLELMKIADDGKIMPPKSTWFEPKLRSGLFIHTLD